MQPLPTEAGPRSVCAQCGKPLPPPNGSATFVYGVGPVGYQSCAACGAKWRYLWQDQPFVRMKPDRGRRMFVVVGAMVLVGLLVVGGVAVAKSQRWNRGGSSNPPTSSTAPATTPSSAPGSAVPVDPATVSAYRQIAYPMDFGRLVFMKWIADTAPALPQYTVNQKADEYIATSRSEIQSLEHARWPDAVAAKIDVLVDADKKFVADLDKLHDGQQRTPSYVDTLVVEAKAVTDAGNAVRQALGLPLASR